MRFEKYKTKSRGGQHRWRLRADNGEIIAHGESYTVESGVDEVIVLIKATNPETPVETVKR